MAKFKRHKKHKLPEAEVNIVSLMDILTTLLFFLILGASFTNYSVLLGSSLQQSGTSVEEKKPVFVLKVTAKSANNVNISLGAIDKLRIVRQKNLNSFLRSNFTGNASTGFTRNIYFKDADKVQEKLRKLLVGIKQGFPHENKIVLVFLDPVKYQDMVNFISSVRFLTDTEESFELENFLGHVEKTRILFPEVIISEDI